MIVQNHFVVLLFFKFQNYLNVLRTDLCIYVVIICDKTFLHQVHNIFRVQK